MSLRLVAGGGVVAIPAAFLRALDRRCELEALNARSSQSLRQAAFATRDKTVSDIFKSAMHKTWQKGWRKHNVTEWVEPISQHISSVAIAARDATDQWRSGCLEFPRDAEGNERQPSHEPHEPIRPMVFGCC
mmetsp:Transcript_118417/g.235860  ORF Transcript_118417/g.235860 Transcript_118417/m.235860 type:complete len:132 (+) Transcript_118417:61-456(+)